MRDRFPSWKLCTITINQTIKVIKIQCQEEETGLKIDY